jgi:hypothetical protein
VDIRISRRRGIITKIISGDLDQRKVTGESGYLDREESLDLRESCGLLGCRLLDCLPGGSDVGGFPV